MVNRISISAGREPLQKSPMFCYWLWAILGGFSLCFGPWACCKTCNSSQAFRRWPQHFSLEYLESLKISLHPIQIPDSLCLTFIGFNLCNHNIEGRKNNNWIIFHNSSALPLAPRPLPSFFFQHCVSFFKNAYGCTQVSPLLKCDTGVQIKFQEPAGAQRHRGCSTYLALLF